MLNNILNFINSLSMKTIGISLITLIIVLVILGAFMSFDSNRSHFLFYISGITLCLVTIFILYIIVGYRLNYAEENKGKIQDEIISLKIEEILLEKEEKN